MSAISKKSIISIGVAILVVGLSLGFYLSRRHVAPMRDAIQFYFHPDSVLGVKWKSGAKEFAYARASRQKEWQPIAESGVLQTKLNLLASAPLEKMEAAGKPSATAVIVRLDFGPKNSWQGQFDGDQFIWNEGNHKGEGFRLTDGSALSDSLRSLFEEGQFAFAPRGFNWCADRPTKIQVKNNGDNFELYQDGPRWKWKSLDKTEASENADATQIERWLGKFCELKVDHYKDLEQFSLGWGSEAEFRVDFAGKKLPLTLIRKKGFWVIDGKAQRAFTSRQFTEALEILGKIPHAS